MKIKMCYLLLLLTLNMPNKEVPEKKSAEQVSVTDEEIPEITAEHTLKKCCIGSALDDTEDHIL